MQYVAGASRTGRDPRQVSRARDRRFPIAGGISSRLGISAGNAPNPAAGGRPSTPVVGAAERLAPAAPACPCRSRPARVSRSARLVDRPCARDQGRRRRQARGRVGARRRVHAASVTHASRQRRLARLRSRRRDPRPRRRFVARRRARMDARRPGGRAEHARDPSPRR